jgi:hypothetical protein
MPTFWYPNTCSEDCGCILQIEEAQVTLVAIAKTCTGHAQSQWGRSVALNLANPQAAQAGDQGRFTAIVQQNKNGQKEPVGSGLRASRDG